MVRRRARPKMPKMRAGTQRRVALFLRTLAAALVAGAVFGGTTGTGFRDAPLPGALLGVLAGVINGATIACFFASRPFPGPRLNSGANTGRFHASALRCMPARSSPAKWEVAGARSSITATS